MKIRFLTTIPTTYGAFHRGQVIDVPQPTADMLAWLEPLPDGSRRAEAVRDDEPEVAIVGAAEHAVMKRRQRSREA